MFEVEEEGSGPEQVLHGRRGLDAAHRRLGVPLDDDGGVDRARERPSRGRPRRRHTKFAVPCLAKLLDGEAWPVRGGHHKVQGFKEEEGRACVPGEFPH